MDLALWLFKNKILKKDFAKILGVHPFYVSHILSGFRVASENLAKRIEKHTGGEVKAHEIRPTKTLKTRKKATSDERSLKDLRKSLKKPKVRQLDAFNER